MVYPYIFYARLVSAVLCTSDITAAYKQYAVIKASLFGIFEIHIRISGLYHRQELSPVIIGIAAAAEFHPCKHFLLSPADRQYRFCLVQQILVRAVVEFHLHYLRHQRFQFIFDHISGRVGS